MSDRQQEHYWILKSFRDSKAMWKIWHLYGLCRTEIRGWSGRYWKVFLSIRRYYIEIRRGSGRKVIHCAVVTY